MTKEQVLQRYFGYSSFRKGQEEIIDSILNGRDVLAVMPTGAGKSICYQVPALMSDGISIVISPLISLMKDQVESLHSNGISVAFLNSSQSFFEFNEVLHMAYEGEFKMLYVAPERLLTPDFIQLAKNIKISMITVDEAHCISQWGQDFRPSYLKITEFVSKLPYRPVITAFTATATAEVSADIINVLKLINPFSITTGFNRENLYFGVEKPEDKYQSLKRIIMRNRGKNGIVYCISRKLTENVCERLCSDGIDAVCYHAGLTDEERRKNQDDFIFDRRKIIVATNAFGMGINKSNVAFVVHYNMPKSVESYYQEAGRAGRDGEPAECILLYSGQDVKINKFLIDNQNENPQTDEKYRAVVRSKDIKRLQHITYYCNTSECLREYILRYFGDSTTCSCMNCSNCNAGAEMTDITVETQKVISCIYRLNQRNMRFGKKIVSEILHGDYNAKIRASKLDTLSTYSLMKEYSLQKCIEIIDFLVIRGYISVSDGEYSVLELNSNSVKFLKNNHKVIMPVLKKTDKERVSESKSTNVIYSIDIKLLEKLKELRKKIADRENVPAYIIFSDASLRDMCVKLPKTVYEFSQVSGVGKVKTEKYSSEFLKLLNKENAVRETAETDNIFRLIIKNSDRIKLKDGDMTLIEFTDYIFNQLGVCTDTKLLKNAVISWLVSENILVNISGRIYDITDKSDYFGITRKMKYRKDGGEYFVILYSRKACQSIIDNMQKISERKIENG